MDTHWEQINSIQMSLHTSELILNHTKNHKELQISCSLVNIARGKCNLSIYEESNKKTRITGKLHISAERAIMSGFIKLTTIEFNELIKSLSLPYVRPISIIIDLTESLPVSIEGILRIDKNKDFKISNFSTIFPLK